MTCSAKTFLSFCLPVMVAFGCSYQERTYVWVNNLVPGSSRHEIERSKPEHVTIHWDKPITTDSLTTEYDVTFEEEALRSVPGPSPQFFLVFREERFSGYGGRN